MSIGPKGRLSQLLLSTCSTTHGRVSSDMPGHVLSPKNCPLAWGDLDPHLTHGFLGCTRVHIQNGIFIGSAVFARKAHHRLSLYFTMSPLPLKIAHSHGGSGPHLIHGSLGPPKSSIQTASGTVQPFFAGITSVTDRKTDHAARSVTIGRIYTYVVLRCGLIIASLSVCLFAWLLAKVMDGFSCNLRNMFIRRTD